MTSATAAATAGVTDTDTVAMIEAEIISSFLSTLTNNCALECGDASREWTNNNSNSTNDTAFDPSDPVADTKHESANECSSSSSLDNANAVCRDPNTSRAANANPKRRRSWGSFRAALSPSSRNAPTPSAIVQTRANANSNANRITKKKHRSSSDRFQKRLETIYNREQQKKEKATASGGLLESSKIHEKRATSSSTTKHSWSTDSSSTGLEVLQIEL